MKERIITPLDDRFEGEGAKCIYYTFCYGEANITRASNGQIDSATEPGFGQNRRPSQSAVVAGVICSRVLELKPIGILILVLLTSAAIADSWSEPTDMGLVSSRGNVVVKVIPGKTDVDSVYAIAKYFRWSPSDTYKLYLESSLLNPIAPVRAFVHEDGRLLTLDNWNGVGHGEIVVIYNPDGEVLRSYTLFDLYPNEKVRDDIDRSTSSIWWRCENIDPFIYGDTVEVRDFLGWIFAFNLKTGMYTHEPSGVECEGRI